MKFWASIALIAVSFVLWKYKKMERILREQNKDVADYLSAKDEQEKINSEIKNRIVH